jgi:hypothetical protein
LQTVKVPWDMNQAFVNVIADAMTHDARGIDLKSEQESMTQKLRIQEVQIVQQIVSKYNCV